jgi:hypothetical protein
VGVYLKVCVFGGSIIRELWIYHECFQRYDSANAHWTWHSVTPSAQSKDAIANKTMLARIAAGLSVALSIPATIAGFPQRLCLRGDFPH